jgi:hypothetical protein
MFLNKTLFKKFMKASFRREGLKVGMLSGGLVIAGNAWCIWTEEGYVPNWLKAAIVELAGTLPEQEQIFKVKKDEPIQYEIPDENYDLPERFRENRTVYKVTPIVITGSYYDIRLLQNNLTTEMIHVPEDFIKVVDLSELEGENAPAGPCAYDRSAPMLIYKNEHSAYGFTRIHVNKNLVWQITEAVSGIDFEEEAK